MKDSKICFFVPFYPTIKGGAEYQSKILAEYLQADGYEVFYISYDKSLNDEVLHVDGFKVYSLNVKSSYQEKITLYESTFSKARRILEIEQPDIVYQRVLNSFSYRISTFTNRRSIPYILHVADNYSVTFKGLKNNIKKLIFKRIVN